MLPLLQNSGKFVDIFFPFFKKALFKEVSGRNNQTQPSSSTIIGAKRASKSINARPALKTPLN